VTTEAAKDVLTPEGRSKGKEWYDERKAAIEERARERVSMLHRRTIATIKEFQEKRKTAMNTC
jgi:hypothetical protein